MLEPDDARGAELGVLDLETRELGRARVPRDAAPGRIHAISAAATQSPAPTQSAV